MCWQRAMLMLTCHAAGLPAAKLFGQGVSFTYDDVIVLPGHVDFGAHEVRRMMCRDCCSKCDTMSALLRQAMPLPLHDCIGLPGHIDIGAHEAHARACSCSQDCRGCGGAAFNMVRHPMKRSDILRRLLGWT